MPKAKKIKPAEAKQIQTEDEALVAIYDGLMRQWREGMPCADRILHDPQEKVFQAYKNVYGDNVVPIFRAFRKRMPDPTGEVA